MKTFFLKERQINKRWLIIDADGLTVGRLAAFVATLLRGKHKPEYTPHMDCGDNVVIINARKVHFTGKKFKEKIYYKYTGYPGGLKETTPNSILNSKFPERIMEAAVKRMLDDGPMARKRFKNLYIYPGPEHKHQGQKPEKVDFASLNRKNKK
ncbi:50S ribosomal protein L13 [Wolbachia endosymbiont of Cruorifilaria tuberocauda]|uniref:50S ribosomal protein L13 n=1 Tax=Wolbachia endosymbiont of Cruorifilaria tuberocauda TaxID=1812111 RepID=UPI00158C2B6E|nr:50S ribosomal protein L13 [Wolbachia endosymbiont of Cruorifilaria tuberocauda]QKX01910.1 50S ribosomal protein L13 [Wolbachia endosymbiont of Cruorifilaria tuberocauda]